MLIHEHTRERKRQQSRRHKHQQHDPSWIVFRSGRYCTRLPFAERIDAWAYVLDITSMGFRADRERDAIIITGCPSLSASEVLS